VSSPASPSHAASVGPAAAAPLRSAFEALRGLCPGTAVDVARGAALGFWFGLLPKENATACLLGLALATIRLNLPAAAAAATIGALLAPALDPLLHRFGLALLTADGLRGTFGSLLALPGGAWLGWDNTVTLGALIAGGLFAFPLHCVTWAAHHAWAASLADRWKRTRLAGVPSPGASAADSCIPGADLAGSRLADRLAGERA